MSKVIITKSCCNCKNHSCKYYGASEFMKCPQWDYYDTQSMVQEYAIRKVDLRNCVNCGHYDICATVRDRKATQANDYSACGHWECR